jgi:hypothetical protein
MKKLIILLAFAGLLTACHRGMNENAGAPGTETGTYQGGGFQSNTNTNSIIVPQEPNF